MSSRSTLDGGPGVYREQGAACLPALLLPPVSRADAFAPERAIAADLLPAADATPAGQPGGTQ